MQARRTWKSVFAIMLTLSMLVGMVSVMGAFPVAAAADELPTQTTEEMKFKADFSELAALAEAGGAFEGDVTYIKPGYTTAVEKEIVAWVNERFDMITGYNKNLNRATLGQNSSTLTTSVDTWSGNNYWNLMKSGYIQHSTKNSGQAYRLVESFVPKYNGEQAVLANFEAKLTFSVAGVQSQPHGILVAFHEKTAGYTRANGDHVFHAGTGSMVLINNGAGSYKKASGFGMAIYDQNNTLGNEGAAVQAPLSAVVSHTPTYTKKVDGANQTFNYEPTTKEYLGNNNIDGEVFENNLAANTKYDLIVRVVGTKVTVTVKDMNGNVMHTKEKTLNKAGEGYISFGSSNAANRFYAIEIQELDEDGKPIPFGTKTGKDELETLKIDFADVPEVQYYDGKYYYDSTHTASDATVSPDMNTAFLTAGNTTYVPDTKDAILADYLESKFAFYYSQEGNTFERTNVNGYAVDTNGVEYTSKTGNVDSYAPDTKMSLGKYVDGIGYSGNNYKNPIAKWYLDSNKYLVYTNNGVNGDGFFRKSGSIAIKDKNGELLQIDNFKLDLDFKMYADGTYDHSNIAVGFHANQPYWERAKKTQAAFVISPFGGYFLGDDYTIANGKSYKVFNKSTGGYDDYTATADGNFATSHGLKNAATGSKASVWPYVATKIGNNVLAHLTLTVVGNTVTAKVTVGDTIILEKTETLNTYYGSGYLFLSGSNQQGWYGDIEVTRLDANGNPVDFSDDNEGFTFGESFDAKATYYYKDSKYWRNTGADVFWMQGGNATYYTFDQPDTYVVDKATVDHLNSKFDFWAYREGSEKKLTAPYQTTEDVLSADTYLNGSARLYYTLEGLTMNPTKTGGGEALRKGFTILPKVNGSPIKARNVEVLTDVVMTYNADTWSMWNIDLRSKNAGEFITSASSNKYATHVGIQIRPSGINIVDGTPFPTYTKTIGESANYSTWNDEALHYNVRVYAKLVNDKLTVKVTDSKTGATLYEVTDKAITYMDEGYVALSTAQAWATISNLYVNVLDGKGNQMDPEAASSASDSYAGAYVAEHNALFPFGSTTQANYGIPAYLRTNNNVSKQDHLNFSADGQHFHYKNREYAVADGYSLVTEGDVTSIIKDADGSVVASTEDYTVDAISYKDEEQTVIKISSNNAEMDAIVKGFVGDAKAYLNARYDAYYIDTDFYKGSSLTDNGWGAEISAIYGNRWLQFGTLANTSLSLSDEPIDNHISLLVPKSPVSGQYLKADDFQLTWDVRLNDSKTFGTAYLVFNMPEAGNIGAAATSNAAIAFNSDLNAIKINSTQFMLWNGTEWVDLIPDGGYKGGNDVKNLVITVQDGKLTGSIAKEGGTAQSFEATLTNTESGYFAIGRNCSGGLDFGKLSISGAEDAYKIATVERTEGGKLTVERATTDVAGMYKYIVTATPSGSNQLQVGSLLAVDEAGETVYPVAERAAFRSIEDTTAQYVFYADSDLRISAEFGVAREASDVSVGNLGTSINKDKVGLRFVSRINVVSENGERYALIDGEKYELADYGMIFATKAGIDWGTANGKGTALELDSTNPYIKPVSVKEAAKYYDLCDDYMDISTSVIGLDRVGALSADIYARAYVVVKLANDETEIVYGDSFASNFNETAGLREIVYLDSQNGNDANAGTEEAPVQTLNGALKLLALNGTIVNKGTVTLPATFGSGSANNTLTLTGGTYTMGARHSTLNSPVTFENTTIVVPDFENTEVWFAAGHKLVIKETVTMNGHFDNLYGGVYQTEDLERTDLEIYAGNYHNIIGGSAKKYVAETHITVGGNVNAALRSEAEGGSHNVGIRGGGVEGADTGDTYITFGGNAYAYMIYGGTVQSGTISGDTHITMNGGECAQIFGGCDRVNMTGNTNVTVTGGTVTRRIYGGCYNEDNSQSFHVTGNTSVTLGKGFEFSKTGQTNTSYGKMDAYEGIRAGSRASQNFNDEVSTLYFVDAAAQSAHSSNLGKSADALAVALMYSWPDTTDATVVLG